VRAELLLVDGLRVTYETDAGAVEAVGGASFGVWPDERLGLVGESGSGKSTLALALMRLLRPPGRIADGQITLGGIDLAKLPEKEMRSLRCSKIALIPQGAMNSLNPVIRVRDHLTETIRAHGEGRAIGEDHDRVLKLLDDVGLDRRVGRMYPHELSGGMKQRVCVAASIALSPELIIADEPTSALDVVVQRQVMETLGLVQRALGASVLLVGHDMGLMAQFVDRLAVMYAGKLMELGPLDFVIRDPLHPYTRLLIASLPSLECKRAPKGIPGSPPSLLEPAPGCLFSPRCPHSTQECQTETPAFREFVPGRWVACHHADRIRA